MIIPNARQISEMTDDAIAALERQAATPGERAILRKRIDAAQKQRAGTLQFREHKGRLG